MVSSVATYGDQFVTLQDRRRRFAVYGVLGWCIERVRIEPEPRSDAAEVAS